MTTTAEHTTLGCELRRALVALDVDEVTVETAVDFVCLEEGDDAVSIHLDEGSARTLLSVLDHHVDRVEVAAVVEAVGELHPLAAPPELCPTCSERTPCRTRRLLRELPGGAA